MSGRFDMIADKVIIWCVYAIVFAAPFSKSISEAAIAIAIIFWALRKVMRRDFRLASTGLNIPILAIIMTAAISMFNSAYLSLSMKAFFTKMLKYIALYFVIVEEMDDRSKLKDLFLIAFFSMAIIMIDGFVQYITRFDFLHLPAYPSFKARLVSDCEGFFRGFPTACFPFPNDLAAWILLTLMPLGCVVIMDLHGKTVRYLGAFVSMGLLSLFFLTKTRGAWLGLGISVLYIALIKKKIWIVLILILILAIPFVLRMEMAQYIFAFGSIGDRMGMWDTAWRILKNHPVTGNGINTFFENFRVYRNDEFKGKKGSYAHNCYLQMACDTGLAGLAAFLWFVFSYFKSVKRGLNAVGDPFFNSVLLGMSVGIFAFLIHSFFDTNLYSLNLATLFWTAVAVSQGIVRVFAKECSAR